jgi:hypothetical protein
LGREPNKTYILCPLGSVECIELQLSKAALHNLIAGIAERLLGLTSAAVERARTQFSGDEGVEWLVTTLPWVPGDQPPPQPLMRYSFVQGLIAADEDVRAALAGLDKERLAPVRQAIVDVVSEEVTAQDEQIKRLLVNSLRQALNDARMMFMPPDLNLAIKMSL